MKTLRFGIEIETVGRPREVLARAIHSVVGGTVGGECRGWSVVDPQGRTWNVVPDGSLSGGENSGEIVSPILNYDDLAQLQEIVRAVRHAGARADASCGIHVHVDGSKFNARSVTNLAKILNKQERIVEKALGISDARLARFCRPIDPQFIARLEARRPRTLDDVRAAWYGYRNATPTRYDSSRYRGMNLNSMFFRGSIELRYFNGSLHAGEIKSYIQFALALAAKALSSKSASSRKREFNPASARYDFRVWLVCGLGMVGDEFKTARHHLTKLLSGSSAWKHGRPTEPALAAAA
jgi:hypothetical protein